MSNTNAPTGFQYLGRAEGGSPTEGLSYRKILSTDTTAIFFGDPVVSGTNGYISQASASPGTTQICGIFYGCEYYSTAVGRKVWSNYYPGSGSGGDILAQVITDPDALFVAQTDNTAIVFADIDANVQFTVGSGNTLTQISGATVSQSTIATTNTLPFRIVGLYSDYAPPGTDGTDNASAYNRVVVGFNNIDRKSLTGIA